MKIVKDSNNLGYFFLIINSLIYEVINNNYSDIIFIIENKEIKCNEAIISTCNNTIKNIINNSKNKNEIYINNITVNGFIMLLKYYGYGIVDINDNNIIDIYITSIILNDLKLKNVCENYINNNLTVKIVKNLLHYLSDSSINISCDIIIKLNNFISLNGNKFFYPRIIIII